jgi:hypothetical protein
VSELGKERVSNGREHMSQLGNERVFSISLRSANALGSPARRELTRSHAKADGRNSRSQTRPVEASVRQGWFRLIAAFVAISRIDAILLDVFFFHASRA